MTATLTPQDLDLLGRARELADAETVEDLRRILGEKPDATQSWTHASAFGAAQYLLQSLADIIERPADRRSTPPGFADCAVVTDARGKQWKYSAPGDVWSLITNELGPGSVGAHSARSYQRLVHEFGPLRGTGEEGGQQ